MVGNRQHHYALWPQAVGQWSIVGSAGFLDTASFSLKLHPITGAPYLAYADGAANRKAAVVTFSNNAWMNVGLAGSSTATVTDISLALNRTTGVPYVLYNDGNPGAQHTGNLGRATMMAYTNNAWSPVGSSTGFSAAAVAFVTMALHPTTGVPYATYTDEADHSNKATVMEYIDNSWSNVGSAGFSAGIQEYTSLALHPITGAPYVAYSDGANSNKATVMTFSGSVWSYVGSAGFSTAPSLISLALHPTTGAPYVAYSDGTPYYVGIDPSFDPDKPATGNAGKVTVMTFDDSLSTWRAVGSAACFSAAAVEYMSLALHPITGVPYVAYTDQGCSDQATVMTFDGSNNWLAVGSVGFSAGPAYNICLALHPTTGAPYVAYRDYGSGMNGGATVMTFT